MIKLIQKIQCQGVKSISPKSSATAELNKHHQMFLPRMVFTDSCRSWYKGGRSDGKVIAIWPGSSVHYYEVIREVRWEVSNRILLQFRYVLIR
jgi:hypothetical protein